MAKCLYCYKELNGNERDFHKACSKKIFGTLEAPILPLSLIHISLTHADIVKKYPNWNNQEKMSFSKVCYYSDPTGARCV